MTLPDRERGGSSLSDPIFPAQPYQGICTFARAPFNPTPNCADVAILGVPYDGGTSYRSGSRLGPRAIREQSLLLWGYNNALRINPLKSLTIVDAGDVNVIPVDIAATHRAVEAHATQLHTTVEHLVMLGGDHSLALPALRAHAKRFGPMAVVHLDAHPDTWNEEFPGQRYSHGTPFRRAIEEGLIDPQAYIMIGIRGPTAGPGDYLDVERLGIRMITMDAYVDLGLSGVLEEIHRIIGSRPTYLSVDIDVADPAYAPGTGTPEPGGLTSWQLLHLVRGLRGLDIKGADLVEVAPPYDPSGITSILAANVIFEYLSLWALQKASQSNGN